MGAGPDGGRTEILHSYVSDQPEADNAGESRESRSGGWKKSGVSTQPDSVTRTRLD